ncbi:phosphopantetheine-binding protein [Streptomyces sp. SID4919]|uniref:Phosphopantetheine-binding protein n=1 Tax=Streptomyces uncialis TaxID=1048205 RepID=A0A1Q4V8A6_9ACTN|nr:MULTISPECIES: phosphopantetheine-binding protein [Streptomyces]MCX4661914.1 phosphopantetheine-binding protein [Streptomyces uncialis]MYY08084.1 phosphopantetheine-binding protein [Streptomyces sp. SID4919]OKH94082.1 phosphopantetheine-binding protein [Streptomyces uncialis]WST72138.1 phosphopantetheine-binding protein [Streptomyces uncialis]WTE09184.1 phosphopantetheine-binding protein [Streptomyces uncialis]
MPASVVIPRRFQDIVRAYLPYAGAGELDASQELAALGLDSMGVVQLLAALEEGYGLEFPDDALDQETFSTVGSLWRMVSEVQHGDE